MSNQLEVKAEILKLARLLRREPDALAYLEQVPAQDLRKLREQVTELLFTAQGPALSRLAAASRLLPIRVVATIGERAFGPLLAARIAGLLDPDRAVEMAETMPVPFLADVAVELDPRRASQIIARISPGRIAAITRELLRRHEYVTMGRFVGHLPDPAIRAALNEFDDVALLRVAFVLESKDTVDQLIALLPRSRRESIVDVAAREQMWIEVLDLLSHVSQRLRREFTGLGALEHDGVLETIFAAAVENDLWGELLPLVPELPLPGQERLARAAAKLDPAGREAILARLRAAGMTEQLERFEQVLSAKPG